LKRLLDGYTHEAETKSFIDLTLQPKEETYILKTFKVSCSSK